MTENPKSAIITGITGQDGAYLADYLLKKNYKVTGILRSQSEINLHRLKYLGIEQQVMYVQEDLTNLDSCRKLLKAHNPHEIYNLAAQSSVSFSFDHPIETVNYNIVSVLNLLEAVRKVNPETRFYQASSSEMFGKANALPITKHSTLHPLSPYGISKATGHWLVSQYREAYGLYATSGILFNHESYLRPGTFFVKKVIQAGLAIKKGVQENLRVGNIDVKRDFGFAKEYVKAIWHIMQLPEADDFMVCSGKSVSLRDIVYYVFDQFQLSRDLIIQDPALYRPTEIQDIYGDNTEIRERTGWKYDLTFFEVLDLLIEEEIRNDVQV